MSYTAPGNSFIILLNPTSYIKHPTSYIHHFFLISFFKISVVVIIVAPVVSCAISV